MRICHVMAYGQAADGSLCPQTISRCNVAAGLYRRGKVHMVYLTCADLKNGKSIAREMALYLVVNGVPVSQIRFILAGSNTAGEIEGCTYLLLKGDTVTAVTSWYHMPRVMYLWLWRLKIVRPAIAFGHVQFYGDFLKEFVKFANSFLNPRRSARVDSELKNKAPGQRP